MCKRLCCCGVNRSEFCQREVHCYEVPSRKLAASFARQTDKIILYGQFAGASFGSSKNDSGGVNFRSGSPFEMMASKGEINGGRFKHISEMSPPEQLQHAATLLQMSPGTRRRASQKLLGLPQHEDFVEAKIWSYQHGTTPLNWQKCSKGC